MVYGVPTVAAGSGDELMIVSVEFAVSEKFFVTDCESESMAVTEKVKVPALGAYRKGARSKRGSTTLEGSSRSSYSFQSRRRLRIEWCTEFPPSPREVGTN